MKSAIYILTWICYNFNSLWYILIKKWRREMRKRLISIALVLMLLLVSCGQTESESETNTTTDTSVQTTEGETELSFDPNVPDMDYGGYEFTFAVRGDGSGSGAWHSTDLIADEMNGETLNDAIFERTTYIEDKYNVKFDLMWCGETSTGLTGSAMSKVINQTIMAGDDTIDVILSSPYDSVGYMINNLIVDLNTVEYLDLSKPWWDQNANENLSFNDKIFFTTGELTIIDNKCTYGMIFSKNVAEMYDIESPYDAVRNGTWTLDKIIADTKKVTTDLNGDTVMDYNDRYGFVSWQDACFGLIHSMGNRFGEIDSNGEPELTFYTERLVNTWEKLINFENDPGFLALMPGHKFFTSFGSATTLDQILATMLDNDQFLYAFATTSTVLQLRECEADFGILPMPKYDESQERYYSTAHGYGTTLMSIPITASDTSRTGLIMEAFAAKSMELVTPAFYNVTLTGKTIRDEDSAEMLDIIYANKIYDIGYFFQWGNLTNLVMNAYNAKDINISSIYESAESAALADVETAKEIFSSLE